MHFPKGNPKEVMAEFACPAGQVLFHADGTGTLVMRDGTEEALTPAVAKTFAFAAKALDEAQKVIFSAMVGDLMGAAMKPCDDPDCPGCVARREAKQSKPKPAPRIDRMFGFETQN